jgi:hypothetical protein
MCSKILKILVATLARELDAESNTDPMHKNNMFTPISKLHALLAFSTLTSLVALHIMII